MPQLKALAHPTHGTHVKSETFVLPDRWALHFYEYSALLEIDEKPFRLHPGCVTIVPPQAVVTFHYEGPSRHLYSHFCTDNKIPIKGTAPALLPASASLLRLRDSLAEALGFAHTNPLRAQVRLWDVLYGLGATGPNAPQPDPDDIATKAIQIAEAQLGTLGSINELAARCGVSHNQFIRIIRRHTGQSPRQWLTRLRMERAKNMLAYSDLPVKTIACEVGIPDLQHFNKIAHKYFGRSPRALREEGERPKRNAYLKGITHP